MAQRDVAGSDALLRDAEARLATLAKPRNAISRRIQDLQDPGALRHKDALQHCVWQLRTLRD